MAITGFGNVGRQVAELIVRRKERFAADFGVAAVVTGVCDSSAGVLDSHGLSPELLGDPKAFDPRLTGSEFLQKVSADVLIEAGPSDCTTGQPGLEYITSALERGIHVVAISKGALVVEGTQLLKMAREKNLHLLMSGAAAAALPTIDFLTHDLAGARVERIEAILTGTTTFILDTMFTRGVSFDEALSEAQRRGIAEPEPSLDVDGWDTAAKVVIIANAVFGLKLSIFSLQLESLRSITPEQLSEWRAAGLTPRLVGYIDNCMGEQADAGVALRVYTAEHPFSLTRGSTKALYAETTDLGDFTLLGGASNPSATAAAALKDLHHILRSTK